MIKKMWVCIFNNKIKNCYAKGVFHSKVFPKKEYAETWWKEHYDGKPIIKQVIITDKDPFENVRKVIEDRKNRIIRNARNSKNIPLAKVRYDYYCDIEQAISKDIANFDSSAGEDAG
jgi:hypothetical protein